MGKNTKKTAFRDFISEEVKIIGNPDFFKTTHTPLQIIDRKETFDFYREVAIFIKYKKPNNLLLKGFPGSGKTVTANFVLREIDEIKDNINTSIVNCNDKSSLDILRILTKQQTKGNFNILMLKFLEEIKKDTLIVFDEIDRSNQVEKLLYYLSRPTELKKDFKKNISVVLISNNLHWEDNLKDSVRSSLQLKTIVFNPYSAQEIKRILKERINLGFVDAKAISSELIDFIADQCVKERSGDCRVAIEAVFYSAQLSESNRRLKIEIDDVRRALKTAINKSDKLLVQKLKDNQLLTLYVVCSTKFNTLEEIHKNYVEVIKNEKINVEKITREMIFHIINYLENLCLISKSISIVMDDKNIPRRNTKIVCNIDDNLVVEELIIRGLRLSQTEDNSM